MAHGIRGSPFKLLPLWVGLLQVPAEGGSIQRRSWQPPVGGSGEDLPAVEIGLPTTLSVGGRHFSLAAEMLAAYELYFSSYVEDFGGVLVNGTRRAIDLYLIDDGDSQTSIRRATQDLIDGRGIRLFLGPYSSELTFGVADAVHRAGGVQLAGGASGTSIFENRPNVFGMLPEGGTYEETSLELVGAADGGSRKSLWYVTYDSDTADFEQYAASQNLDVVGTSLVPRSGDWRALANSIVDELMAAQPDTVFAKVYQPMCHELVKRAWEVGYSPKALVLITCPAGESFIKAVGHAGQFVLHVIAWMPSINLQGPLTRGWTSQNFSDTFAARYGSIPVYQVASAFACAGTLVRAIEDADSLEPQAVADVLRAMHADSIFGRVRFGTNGQNTVRMKVTQYQMTSLPLLVYPCTACDGSFVYPKPNRSAMECLNNDEGLKAMYGLLNGTCQMCPEGTESAVAAVSGTSKKRICRACDAGRAGGNGWTGSCKSCQAGHFSSIPGELRCRVCPRGHFANSSGSTGCLPCAAGRAARMAGEHECRDCLPGAYQNASGMSGCLRCGAGTFAAHRAMASCQECPPTFTTPGTGFRESSACQCAGGTMDVSLWDASAAPGCEACQEGIRCELGLPVGLMPGYYADASTFNPLKGVWRCILDEACPGGPPGTCGVEFEGAVCSFCPVGKASTHGRSCRTCETVHSLIPFLVLTGLVLVLVGLYYCANGRVVKITTVKLGFSITASISITIVQLFGMLYKLNVPWPGEVKPILEGASMLVLDVDALALECFMGREPLFRYLGLFTIPFMAIAIMTILEQFSRLLPMLTRGRMFRWTFPKAFNALCSFGQTSFIALTSIATVSVQCYPHPNGEVSMERFPSIVCFRGEHVGILIMGGILVFCLVIPFLVLCIWGCYIVYVATSNRGTGARQLEMYRFLIFRYRPMVWWWGNVYNVRQLLLGFAPMITPEDPGLQLCFVLLVLLIYLIAVTSYCPWRSIEMNFLDVTTTALLSYIVVAVSMILPPSRWGHRYSVTLLVLIISTLTIVSVALLYAIGLLAMRGVNGPYGFSFPPEAELDDFADDWHDLMARAARLSINSHRHKVRSMNSFDRLSIDRVMCILSASFDVSSRKTGKRKSMLHQKVGSRTRALRMCISEDVLRHSLKYQVTRESAMSDEDEFRRHSKLGGMEPQPEEEEDPKSDEDSDDGMATTGCMGVQQLERKDLEILARSLQSELDETNRKLADTASASLGSDVSSQAVSIQTGPSPRPFPPTGSPRSARVFGMPAIDDIMRLIDVNTTIPFPEKLSPFLKADVPKESEAEREKEEEKQEKNEQDEMDTKEKEEKEEKDEKDEERGNQMQREKVTEQRAEVEREKTLESTARECTETSDEDGQPPAKSTEASPGQPSTSSSSNRRSASPVPPLPIGDLARLRVQPVGAFI